MNIRTTIDPGNTSPPKPVFTVPRRRLIERLARSPSEMLVVVNGPAGSGKSTVVRQWLGETGLAAAWLSCESPDNDPAVFYERFAVVLRDLCQAAGLPAPPVVAEQVTYSGSIDSVVFAAASGVARVLSDVAIVLDDWHAITDAAVLHAIAYLSDRLPAGLRLVLVGRAATQIRLSRLRVAGALIEIGVEDLNFTLDETAVLLGGDDISREFVAAIQEGTGGWPFAVGLAGLIVREQGDPAAALAAARGTHAFVADYLSEQVLESLTPELREFAVTSAVFDEITAPLADAVCERANSASHLDAFAAMGLVTASGAGSSATYRYHPLFLAYLRNEFGRSRPEAAGTLQRRAAAWFEATGDMEQAVEYALRAPDHGLAARLVGVAADALKRRGAWQMLLGWLDRLPASLVEADAGLRLAQAWALVHTDRVADPNDFFDALERICTVGNDKDAEVEAEITLLRTRLAARRGAYAETIANARRALRLYDRGEAGLRGDLGFDLATAAWAIGDTETAEAALADAGRAAASAGNLRTGVLAAYYRGAVQVARGRLGYALGLFQQGLQSPDARAATIPITGVFNTGIAEIHYARNELDEARSALDEAYARAASGGESKVLIYHAIVAARIAAARRDFDGALLALEDITRLTNWSLIDAWQARLWIMRGEAAVAARWLDGMNGRDAGASLFERVTIARVQMALGRWQEAGGDIARLVGEAESCGRHGDLIELLVLRGQIESRLGQRELAAATYGRAISLAAAEGHARVFLDEGSPARDLVETVARRWTGGHYAGRLLTQWDSAGDGVAGETSAETRGQGVSALSLREREVLTLIAAGRTNQDIATELLLTVGTAKWHVHNILGKLGARTRTEAVARARSLSLLS